MLDYPVAVGVGLGGGNLVAVLEPVDGVENLVSRHSARAVRPEVDHGVERREGGLVGRLADAGPFRGQRPDQPFVPRHDGGAGLLVAREVGRRLDLLVVGLEGRQAGGVPVLVELLPVGVEVVVCLLFPKLALHGGAHPFRVLLGNPLDGRVRERPALRGGLVLLPRGVGRGGGVGVEGARDGGAEGGLLLVLEVGGVDVGIARGEPPGPSGGGGAVLGHAQAVGLLGLGEEGFLPVGGEDVVRHDRVVDAPDVLGGDGLLHGEVEVLVEGVGGFLHAPVEKDVVGPRARGRLGLRGLGLHPLLDPAEALVPVLDALDAVFVGLLEGGVEGEDLLAVHLLHLGSPVEDGLLYALLVLGVLRDGVLLALLHLGLLEEAVDGGRDLEDALDGADDLLPLLLLVLEAGEFLGEVGLLGAALGADGAGDGGKVSKVQSGHLRPPLNRTGSTTSRPPAPLSWRGPWRRRRPGCRGRAPRPASGARS